MGDSGKVKASTTAAPPDAKSPGSDAGFIPRKLTPQQLFGSERMAGVQGDAAAAAGQISRTMKVWRKAAGGDANQADAVGDHVADSLHDDKKGSKTEKGEGKDNAEGESKEAEAGNEKAPKIGAKLDGVARKIFLADDKKASAAVKRLGNAGQDNQALKDALKKVQHERSACLDELNQLKGEVPRLGLAKPRADQATRSIDGALNSLNDHLTDSDITGAMRDVAGDPRFFRRSWTQRSTRSRRSLTASARRSRK